jgi:hypothetical protein
VGNFKAEKRITLKLFVQKNILKSELTWPRLGSNVGFCEHDNEPSGHIHISSSATVNFSRKFNGVIMGNCKESMRNFFDMVRSGKGRNTHKKHKLQ